ncbi:svp1-like protein 2 [Moniliophthora roreri MCA 2997]|uniref:Svp1-like protein 2 n=2 Tax=Moniliophthora roreri TaxID=221103 RepID=V2XXE1_MONRO|nr:svp1-like protein 2 [Moniliophthora roreri MCA 2997]KAI3612604.1 svp1-like protein 2 [Moniliophthora roreri]
MNLARHSITATSPIHIYNARFDADCQIFTTCTPAGFAVYRTWPMTLLRKRELSGGTLAAAVPMHTSSLLFLLGGGRSPLFPPNKVILWDDAIGSEVAELEFREKVRGIACRRGWLAVALRRRVVVFEVGEQVARFAEWDTCDNPRGLVSIATAAWSTLLAIPGRQQGHVQLIHLPPCAPPTTAGPPPSRPPSKPPPPPSKHPVSIIIAHHTALTTLSLPPSGRLLATTSSRGTLVRIWDTISGQRIHEFRRGTDKADIFGVAFRPDEAELCVWSDKGTVHVFTLVVSSTSNRQSSLSGLAPFIPLPKYFESEWSYAQYRIPTQSSHISLTSTTPSPTEDVPDEERCVVGWIQIPVEDGPEGAMEHQLVALTYVGGWYRLSLPNAGTTSPTTSSPSGSPSSPPKAMSSRSSVTASKAQRSKDKGKEKEKDAKANQCILQEYRRFGRWDGWG